MRGRQLDFPLTLSAGQFQVIRPQNWPMSQLIVSVKSGLLDIFRGELAGGIPWRCVPELFYQWEFPPSADYIFCVQAVMDTIASVVIMGE